MTMRLLPPSRELGWTPYGWLIYLCPLLLDPLLSHAGALGWATTLAGIAVFLPLYFRGYWLSGARLRWIIAAITVLGVIFSPLNHAGGVYFIYAAAFAGEAGRPRLGRLLVGAITAVALGEALLLRQPVYQWGWVVVFSLLIGALNVHQAEVRRVNAKIRLAHDEVEHLARVAERERIARDLHDLLGHTLSLIVLKAELAAKLSERDPARARAEIEDVERISRAALGEVRAAVRGYRALGLGEQLDTARTTLTAAGVTVDMGIAEVPLSSSQEAVLALVVREAVTNIVRHADAAAATIRLGASDGHVLLEIRDDGRGGADLEGAGLAGMRERIAELSGTLERDGRRGTRLTVRLPVDQPAAVPAGDGDAP